MDEIEKKILNDIEQTGFITELKTVTLLSKKGWDTHHSYTYEDKDEDKSREIDVYATKGKFIKEVGLSLNMYLIIETKKSKNPWIIFTTQTESHKYTTDFMYSSYNDKINTEVGGNIFTTSIFEFSSLNNNNPRKASSRIGKAFHELNKSPSDKSMIYSSLISAGKAAKYIYDSFKFKNDNNDFQTDGITFLSIYLPIVILEGSLYEVFNDSTGEIKIKKESFIPIEMRYSSPNYKEDNWDINFYQNLVTFDYLEKHIDNLETWQESMLEKLSADLKQKGKLPYTGSSFYT